MKHVNGKTGMGRKELLLQKSLSRGKIKKVRPGTHAHSLKQLGRMSENERSSSKSLTIVTASYILSLESIHMRT